MAMADDLAAEVAGQPETYCKVAIYRRICELLD